MTDKRIDPGDTLSVARHQYVVKYSPVDLGAVGPPPPEVAESDVFGKSLLERAGLERQKFRSIRQAPAPDDEPRRFEVTSDEPGQLKFHKLI